MKDPQQLSRNGFTLLEIMIVVIIVGVLASLALPKFGSIIERTRAVEAIETLTRLRGALERCYLNTRNYTQCIHGPGNPWVKLTGNEDPGSAVNSHFYYAYSVASGANTHFALIAVRNTRELVAQDGPQSITCAGISHSYPSSMVELCGTPTTIELKGVGLYEGI